MQSVKKVISRLKGRIAIDAAVARSPRITCLGSLVQIPLAGKWGVELDLPCLPIISENGKQVGTDFREMLLLGC